MKKAFLLLVAFILVLPVSLVSLVSTVSAQSFTPVTLYSVGAVKVNNITRQELYNFTTDLVNDADFYPGIENTVLITQGNPVTKVGNVYLQTGSFGGFPFETTIEVIGGKNGVYVRLIGTGTGVTYDSINAYYPTPDGGAIFNTNAIITGIGLTPEFQNMYVNAAFSTLLSVLGKTGTVYSPISYEISGNQVQKHTKILNTLEKVLKKI